MCAMPTSSRVNDVKKRKAALKVPDRLCPPTHYKAKYDSPIFAPGAVATQGALAKAIVCSK